MIFQKAYSVLSQKDIFEMKEFFDHHTLYLAWQLTMKEVKGTFQKRFSGFCPLRGYPPPPTPLTENHFAKKPLAERGGTPPPLTENRRKFSSKNGSKGAKIGVFWPKIAVF